MPSPAPHTAHLLTHSCSHSSPPPPTANENFVRGRRDLLKDIHRRKPTNMPPEGVGGGAGPSGSLQHSRQNTLVPVSGSAIEVGSGQRSWEWRDGRGGQD